MTLEMILYVAAIVALIMISAFFSGSETALTAASRAHMYRLEQDGDRRARLVNRLRQRKERLIGGLLLGNNLANILASALATNVLIGVFGNAGVAYATVVMTALVLIFGEVLPKTYGINQPDRMALFVAAPVRIVVTALSPIVLAVQAVVLVTLRVAGVDVRAGSMLSASEELRGTIDLHAHEGTMVKHERDMLGSILDLDQVAVADIMVHRKNMKMIDAGEPAAKIVEEVLASEHTRLPVWRDNLDNIIGVLHVKDLLRAVAAAGGKGEQLDIARIAAKPWFVPETTTLLEQLTAFRQRRAHFALVVDEYGALMGMVTLEDILEEIVGDIRDEHDMPVSGVRPQPDGSYIVDGQVTIRDLNRQFDWRLPDD